MRVDSPGISVKLTCMLAGRALRHGLRFWPHLRFNTFEPRRNESAVLGTEPVRAARIRSHASAHRVGLGNHAYVGRAPLGQYLSHRVGVVS